MIDSEDFPTVGLTAFDLWFNELRCIMITSRFVSVTEAFTVLSREDWIDYYESGYTPQDAFEEDLTCYGE